MEVTTAPHDHGRGPVDSVQGHRVGDSISPREENARITAEFALDCPPNEPPIPPRHPDSDVTPGVDAPDHCPDPRSEWRLEGDRLDLAKRYAIEYLAGLPDPGEEDQAESVLLRIAIDLIEGFGLRFLDAYPLLEFHSEQHDSHWSRQRLWDVLSEVSENIDEPDRPRGWLMARREAEQIRRLSREVDVEAVVRRGQEFAQGGKIDSIKLDREFLEELALLEFQNLTQYKVVRARFRRMPGWKQGEFDEVFRRHRESISAARRAIGKDPFSEGEIVPSRPPPRYLGEPGSMFVSTTTDKGEFRRELIATFDARIAESITRDDGSGEPKRLFRIEARSARNPDLVRSVEVPADRYDRMEWLTPMLGVEFSIISGRGFRDHARAAIQSFSDDCVERTIYAHTGWRRVDGRWVYLHRRGGVGAEGNEPSISVELAGNAARYALPDPPEGEELANAILASLGLLDLANPEAPGSTAAAAVLYAATCRAAMSFSTFALQFHGITGSLKSSFAALAQQHFGRLMDANSLPASWANDTILSIGELATRIGDGIVVVDDFVPRGTSQEISRRHSEVQSFFQMIGNHAGRQRLHQDGSPRPSPPPNCLPISTGEDRIHGGSADARTLPVRFTVGMIDKVKLARCQADAGSGLYASSMAGYLRWLAPQLDGIRADLEIYVLQYRSEFYLEGDHGRMPDILAHLRFGAETFLRFAVEVGAIDRVESERRLATIRAGLSEVASEVRADRSEESDPCDQFLRLVSAALSGGKAYLGRREDDGAPYELETLCGWRPLTIGIVPGWGVGPNAERVGWIDGDTVLLHPENSYALARRLADLGGHGFATSRSSLSRMLLERGMLNPNYGCGKVRGAKFRVAGRAFIGRSKAQIAVLPIPANLFWPEVDRSGPVQTAT